MRTLINIFDIIQSENIELEESKLLNKNKGIYVNLPGILSKPIIGISTSLSNNSKSYISTLAEELGHHFTTYGNLIRNPKNYYEEVQNSKKEVAARRWAANFIIEDEDFIKSLNDSMVNIYNMSECFNVTEELIKYKIRAITLNEDLYIDIKNKFILNEVPYMCCNI